MELPNTQENKPSRPKKRKSRFWAGTSLALALGVPGALIVRTYSPSSHEAEHVHGGDPQIAAELSRLSGADRLALLRRAAQDVQPSRRLAVAEVLAGEKNVEGLALAKELLRDNDSEVRLKAVRALTQAGAAPERPYLYAALQDDDLWLRQEVLQWATTNAGRKNGGAGSWLVPGLIARLQETSDTQRMFATSALAKLTGKPWRYSTRLSAGEKATILAKWEAWWQTQKPQYPVLIALPDITPKRSDPAPSAAFQTIDGRTVSPATQGKVRLLNFWGTWCEPCRQEIPALQKLHERYEGKGLEVVGVALGEKEGASGLRAWCAKNGLTYPQALATTDVLEAYGDIHEVPISVLVDKKGHIRFWWRGERDYASFAHQTEKLLSE